jgi:hypothetical protein
VTDASASLRLVVTCGPLAGPLVARVVGIAAARADLSVDRVEEALEVADSVASRAPAELSSMQLELDVQRHGAGIVLRVGMLRPQGSQRIVDGEGAIARLATSWTTEQETDGELLVLEIAPAAGQTASVAAR